MTWGESGLRWLNESCPKLATDKTGMISGELQFFATWDGERLHINEYVAKGTVLSCTYQIKIVGYDVYETAGAIANVAKSRGLGIDDLHMYDDNGKLCLASRHKIREACREHVSLKSFMEQFVVPFFYAQKFFEIHGKWPWGELGHGTLGLLEDYAQRPNTNKNDLVELASDINKLANGKQHLYYILSEEYDSSGACSLCSSGENLANHRASAIKGVQKVRSERKQYKLSKGYLFSAH
jgi:hypothetical protein